MALRNNDDPFGIIITLDYINNYGFTVPDTPATTARNLNTIYKLQKMFNKLGIPSANIGILADLPNGLLPYGVEHAFFYEPTRYNIENAIRFGTPNTSVYNPKYLYLYISCATVKVFNHPNNYYKPYTGTPMVALVPSDYPYIDDNNRVMDDVNYRGGKGNWHMRRIIYACELRSWIRGLVGRYNSNLERVYVFMDVPYSYYFGAQEDFGAEVIINPSYLEGLNAGYHNGRTLLFPDRPYLPLYARNLGIATGHATGPWYGVGEPDESRMANKNIKYFCPNNLIQTISDVDVSGDLYPLITVLERDNPYPNAFITPFCKLMTTPFRDTYIVGQDAPLYKFELFMNDPVRIGYSQITYNNDPHRKYWFGSLADYFNRILWMTYIGNNFGNVAGEDDLMFIVFTSVFSNKPITSDFLTTERFVGRNVYKVTGNEYIRRYLLSSIGPILARLRSIFDLFNSG
jgi:hypothetical protein